MFEYLEDEIKDVDRPKIGVALSGASGRAIAHAGVLEVFDEHGIPIDYIAACSSGTIIATAYATGKLKEIKKEAFGLTKKELLRFLRLSKNNSGFLSLDKVDDRLKFYAGDSNIEDLKPRLAFVSVDLDSGEQVVVSMGNSVRGIRASCSVPGLFETTKWGGKNLADGGLVNLVPTDVVREMGADIVIAVDIAASRFIFSDKDIKLLKRLLWLVRGTGLPYSYLKRFFNYIKRKLLLGNFIQFYSQSDFLDETEKFPGLLDVVGRIIDISINRKNDVSFEKYADVIIDPKIKHHGRTEFSLLRSSYGEGRKAAKNAIPEIVRLIEEKQLENTRSTVAHSKEKTRSI